MIGIIDYGMGNVGSIVNMLKKLRIPALVSSQPAVLERASKLILPGVGAFDEGKKNLQSLGLADFLERRVMGGKTPLLGICLGMQLMTQKSQEGKMPGLGWVEGETVRFSFDAIDVSLKVPHMGWNTVSWERPDTLSQGLEASARFYFVHSYHVVCDGSRVLSKTQYGFPFVSSFRKGHLCGVQFHPEKSHRYGMTLLKNFCEDSCSGRA